MKRSLTIDYGDDVLLALGMSPEQFCEEARFRTMKQAYLLIYDDGVGTRKEIP